MGGLLFLQGRVTFSHRPVFGALLMLFSSAPIASELADLDRALAQRQRSDLNSAIEQVVEREQYRAIYLNSTLDEPLTGIEAVFRRDNGTNSVATLQFFPIPGTTYWRVELPALVPGDYVADVQIVRASGITQIVQKIPFKTAVGMIEWTLQDRLIGALDIDSTHWLRESPGWWSTAVDWVVPDGARQRISSRQPRRRPDYVVAKQQCAAAQLSGLAGMLHSTRETLLTSDLVEDFLDCVSTLDLRFAAYQILESWPDGQLSARSWTLLLSLLRRDIAHGHSERALQILTHRVPMQQTATQEARWRDLVSRLLLARGQRTLAQTYLREGPHMQADQTLVGDTDLQLLFQTMRLNLAISLLRDEQTHEALNVLDQIGGVTPSSKAVAALRDHANVLLGWQFLHQEQGLTAQAAFNRVDLHGDAAAAALLGRGYALVAPPGERQQREESTAADSTLTAETAATLAAKYRGGFISCEQYQRAQGDETVCARARAFDQVGENYSAEERQRRALQSWLLVAERDGVDLATQEARLHAAAALIAVGRDAAAQNMLERALWVFDQYRNAPNQQLHWLREQVLGTTLNADQAMAGLAETQPQSTLAKDTLARWLALEETRALFGMRAKASELELPERVAQADQLLLASLNQVNDGWSDAHARMESEIRLRLAKLYHREAVGG